MFCNSTSVTFTDKTMQDISAEDPPRQWVSTADQVVFPGWFQNAGMLSVITQWCNTVTALFGLCESPAAVDEDDTEKARKGLIKLSSPIIQVLYFLFFLSHDAVSYLVVFCLGFSERESPVLL